ncbi:hypothetical protein M419DRAFT_130022 [Trichoderma reesei RUT C-30]|uniref:Uncharacterized protein n=1 Tax=Hypocrea jecorina (strain ATCC 56765 / BCRC 32924 / NRRL 11460 / Rut C-30) TaxID=1344414 RepID=A0A024SA56_HYPJR|nr:hypothetical protein M419DRAFT_130022 [Trichoderma reesei RUT C-30]
MPTSSTGAVYDGSIAGSGGSHRRQPPRDAGSHGAIRIPRDPSYSLNRFLQGSDERPPPGLGQAQSEAEAEQRMQERLRAFGAEFAHGGTSATGRNFCTRTLIRSTFLHDSLIHHLTFELSPAVPVSHQHSGNSRRRFSPKLKLNQSAKKGSGPDFGALMLTVGLSDNLLFALEFFRRNAPTSWTNINLYQHAFGSKKLVRKWIV